MNAAASHSTIYKAVLNGSMKSILDEVKAGHGTWYDCQR